MRQSSIPKVAFYLTFLVIPVIWWIVLVAHQGIWAQDWYSQASFWGRLAGMAGIGLFAGNILLSSRHPLLDRWFHGLDQAYLLHRSTGKLVAYLLILHAALIGLRWVTTSWTVVSTVWFAIPANLDLLLGRTAWLLLIGIVTITLYVRMRYESKKLIHYWLSLSLLLGATHALLISTVLTTSTGLAIYLFGIIAAALILFTTRTLLGQWLVPSIKVRVTDVVPLGSNVTRIDLAPRTGQAFPNSWLPGQFAFLRLKLPQWRYDDHPFSIISAPTDGKISFAAKQIGDFTRWLPNLPVGTEAQIEGPYGGFSYLNHTNPYQVWIAGGIGITPFVAMANHFASHPDQKRYSIQLVYSVTTPDEAVFATQLKTIVESNPNFTLVLWDSTAKGYLTADWFTTDQLKSADFLICGPQALMSSLHSQLKTKGVSSDRIHSEKFRLF